MLNMSGEVELRWYIRHTEAVRKHSPPKGMRYPHYFSTEVIETPTSVSEHSPTY